MAKFEVNKPIVQADPTIRVDVAPGASLPLGANRFRLVVVDSAGNESAPTVLDVIVRDMEKPTAILDMVDSTGKRIDPIAAAGQSFILSGARSSDVAPGKIKEYRFTLLP